MDREDYGRLKGEETQLQRAVLRSNLAIGQSKMKTWPVAGLCWFRDAKGREIASK